MKILLPVDGSEFALDAVRHALRLVRDGLQASFVLANVQEPVYLYEMVLAHDSALIERASDEAGRHALQAAEALCREAGVPFDSEVAFGNPAHTLVDLAEEHGCDAVIVGARGVGFVRGAVFGSVSQALLHDSPLPVTVVRHRDAEPPPDETGSEADADND